MFFGDDFARFTDVPGFVAKEAGSMNERFDIFRFRPGKLIRSPILPEQRRRDDVDHLVRALRREDRRDQQLQRIRKVKSTLRIRIRSFQSGDDL